MFRAARTVIRHVPIATTQGVSHASSRLQRPKDVSVDEVADATIEAPTDAIVKITATNICGSDLHMYEGRTSLEPGKVLGHENLGEVVEVGPAW